MERFGVGVPESVLRIGKVAKGILEVWELGEYRI